MCKSWPRPHEAHGYTELADKFCYFPHYAYKKNKVDDFIMFNGQKRDVSAWGNQGYRELEQTAVHGTCDEFCYTYHDMPVMEGNALAPSRIVINDHVDDMCDHCK